MKQLTSTSIIIILLLSLSLSTSAFQTSGVTGISGIVKEDNDMSAGYATISLYQAKDSTLVKGTLSTTEGTFSLAPLKPGKYYITINYMGFQKYSSALINLDSTITTILPPIVLQRETTQLGEVQITANKPMIEQQLDKTVMNVENSPIAAGNNVLELLQKAPGVTLNNDQISLRGKSGVQVLIDGKPTYLSSEQLAALLRSTQASALSAIEIITNPSSKFDAAGSMGIINIRMKRNQNYGTTASLDATAGQGIYHKASVGGNIGYRNKAFNLSGSYNYNNSDYFRELLFDRKTQSQNGITYFNSSSFNLQNSSSNNYRGLIDINLDTKNTLTLLASGNFYRGKNHQTGTNYMGAVAGSRDSAVVGENSGRSPYDYTAYSLAYRNQLDTLGTELTASLDYSRASGSEYHNFLNRYTDAVLTDTRLPLIFENYTPSLINIYVGKADYNHPIGKSSKIEIGIKSAMVKADNRLIYNKRLQDGSYINDVLKSDHFLYKENVNAAYMTYSTSLKSLSLQAGLRAEHTSSEGNSIARANIVKRSYLNIFPTFYLKQKLSEKQSIGFSYSRRIDRPDYGSLNPFIYYVDQYTYSQGNPYLNPQLTNAYELNYSLQNVFSASLGYRHTTAAITNVILTDPGTGAIYQTNQNLSLNNYYNLNINAPVAFTKWWSSYNNIVLYYNEFKSPDVNGVELQLAKLAYQLSSTQTFKLSYSMNAEINAVYISKGVSGIFNTQAIYGADLGISKTMLKKQLNLKIAATDVFYTRGKQSAYSDQLTNTFAIKSRSDSRVVRISINYRFGNQNVKSPDKKNGAESEENRLNKK
jgi:ferric enterobactin receptor